MLLQMINTWKIKFDLRGYIQSFSSLGPLMLVVQENLHDVS